MDTPFETSGGQWTSIPEGEQYLDLLATTYNFSLRTLAHTVENRPIRAAVVGLEPEEADQVCLLVAMQHGNEPASREGVYAFLRNLGEGLYSEERDYFSKVSWIIVPGINLDRHLISRRNANNIDLNRDWLDRSQPETMATINTVETFKPTIVLDGHEMHHGFDADVGLSVSPADEAHPNLYRLSIDARTYVANAIIDSGSTYQQYPRGSEVTLRRWAGLQHAVPLLVETYAWNDERDPIPRVRDHVTAYTAMFRHHIDNYDWYRRATDLSRGLYPEVTGRPYLINKRSIAKVGGANITEAYLGTSSGIYKMTDHLSRLFTN